MATSSKGATDRSYATLVQDSRKGDRFHHIWAAVQSLRLLDQRSHLREVWVEGSAGSPVPGDEIVDVVEYYGTDDATVDRVAVRQLKYSTQRAGRNMTLSDIGSSLQKFALIDGRRHEGFAIPEGTPTEYSIVTNRPIGSGLRAALRRVSEGATAKSGSTQEKMQDMLGATLEAAAALARRITLDTDAPGLKILRAQLDVLAAEFSGASDPASATLLLDMISARASGEITGPMSIADVALAFKATVDQLVPAPSMLEAPSTSTMTRQCYRDLADQVVDANGVTLITAVGGAGKSTFAAQLPSILADRADVVIYDCFGEGGYRSAHTYRHRHRDGLVQIASEMAAHGLCLPLVLTPGVEPTEITKAFVKRLDEASRILTERDRGRHLVLLVDAADNAAIAAEEHAGERTFVHDLWHLPVPPNVHIVLTCRPHRAGVLRPPASVTPVPLPEFSLAESATMLRARFSDAGDLDAAEFHRQTSGNPRTQASALAGSGTKEECLRALSVAASHEGEALDNLLAAQLEHTLELAGPDKPALEKIGLLLSILRPRIPIGVLASLSGSSPELIRSFVSDFGRGLIVTDEAVNFRDEPTETFFRQRYTSASAAANDLVAQLTAVGEENAYVAASLPQVLWGAQQYDKLMELGNTTPNGSKLTEIEQRQVSQLRTSFALLAAFKLRRLPDIVQLALVAGQAQASGDRRYALLRDAADLTGEFLDRATLDELRAARVFPSPWPGASLSAEAVMLAVDNRLDEARSRLRIAIDALHAYARTAPVSSDVRIDARQVAHVALATLRLQGPKACAGYIERWQPDSWVLEITQVVSATLLDRGSDHAVQAIGTEAETLPVALAVAGEQQRRGQAMSSPQLDRAWLLFAGAVPDYDLSDFDQRDVADLILRGAAWISATAVRVGKATRQEAATLLDRFLPDKPPNDLGGDYGRPRAGLLHAYVLRAHLLGEETTADDLAPTPAPPADARKVPRDSRAEDRARLLSVLPWIQHWARVVTDGGEDTATLALLKKFPTSRSHNRDGWFFRKLAATTAIQIGRGSQSDAVVDEVRRIVADACEHSGIYLATDIVKCLHGDERFADAAYACLRSVAEAVDAEKQTADQTIDDYLSLARAAYPFDREEARHYFSGAVTVASRVGEDAWDRWRAVLAIGEVTHAEDEESGFALAAHLADTAEAIQPYLGDAFDTEALLQALQRLTGRHALALVSKWRDRRFGDVSYMINSLVQGGLFDDVPHLALALAPLCERIDLSGPTASLARRGQLDAKLFDAIQSLSWRLGRHLDPEVLGAAVSARFHVQRHDPPLPEAKVRSSLDIDGETDYQRKRQTQAEEGRRRLAEADLTRTDMVPEIDRAMDAIGYSEATAAFVEEMRRRPQSQWASIVRVIGASSDMGNSRRGALLIALHQVESNSGAFAAELRSLASHLLTAEATDLVLGRAYPLNLHNLSTITGRSDTELLHEALAAADPTRIVASYETCYKLASTVAVHLTPAESNVVLSSTLNSIDRDLELNSRRAPQVVPPQPTLTSAVATFLWTAMADPQIGTRWRAMHSVRFLLETADSEFTSALISAVTTDPSAYVETKFPFYRMHAIDSMLLATERAGITRAANAAPLLPLVALLQDEFRDHLRIQETIAHIAKLVDDTTLVEASTITPMPATIVPWADMPHTPKPFQPGAPRSEFRFDLEFDEHHLGPLSTSFRVDHSDVLADTSDVILNEWEWRGRPELDADPRRAAAAYADGETWSHHGEWPRADDLDFYLSHHAALTVAGRLLRTNPPLKSEGDEQSAFDRWWSERTLRRPDRRWIADVRRPMPNGLGHDSSVSEAYWPWKVSAGDLEQAFRGEERWVTVNQYSSNETYGGRETISIASALVGREAASALVFALQTASSLQGNMLPRSGAEDEIAQTPFNLRGWVTDETRYGGTDSHDPLAEAVEYPVNRPSDWIRSLLQLKTDADELTWTLDDAVVAESETWADKSGGRERSGPEGNRLRVRPDFLTRLAKATESDVIVEVRVLRRPSRDSYYHPHTDELGYIDGYVRYFLYSPDAGWRDYLGHNLSGPRNRAQPPTR